MLEGGSEAAPLVNLQWAQALAALLGALIGAAGGIFTGGWRIGRIESRLELRFQKAIDESEKRIEQKVDQSQNAFSETLIGLRQKINTVELESERRFLPRDDFSDFRQEHRQDVDRILKKLDELAARP